MLPAMGPSEIAAFISFTCLDSLVFHPLSRAVVSTHAQQGPGQ